LQLLYLDSYYFYAPNPRVAKLKHKLSQYRLLRNYKLLYDKFSSPRYFVHQLTQTIYGEQVTSILALRKRRGKLKFSVVLQKALNLLEVLSGRARRKRLRLDRLIEIVGDERSAMIEFIVFTLQNPDAESKVKSGYCEPKQVIDREVALALLDLEKPEAFAELLKRHTSLYKLYEDYMLCRACRILGLDYPDDVIRIEELDESYAVNAVKSLCVNCTGPCKGRHIDDMRRAGTLLIYAERRQSNRVYIATIATVSKPKIFQQECFSCLAKCIEQKAPNIIVLD